MGWFTLMPRRVLALLIGALALFIAVPLVVVTAQDVAQMSNDQQKDWLTGFVQDKLSTPERQIRLSNIDGALGSDVSVREITISDSKGVWLRVNNAHLTWSQAALFLGRLEIQSLQAESIDYIRNAVPSDQMDLPPPEAGTLEIPQFPVAVILQELSVPKVTFGENVFGLGSEISLGGSLTLDGGNLTSKLDIVRLDGPGGTLGLDVDYKKDSANLDLGLNLTEPPNGVLANLLNIEGRPAVELSLKGSGPVSDLTAQLNLKANGQTALSGAAGIKQTDAGFATQTVLRGPLSTLMAEPYRPFFGANTILNVSALLRKAGGVSVSNVTLSGGQLALKASAETSADNFLQQLTLNAQIADGAGGLVTLPVPGAATQVQGARLTVDFGQNSSENWTSTLGIDGYQSNGFAAKTIAFNVGGVAANLSDAANRRITFNGDGTVSGITATDEVEAALGDSIGLGVAGLWTAGQPVQLAQFRVVGKALTAALDGVIDGAVFKGNVALDTSSIAPFSGLAGRQLSGALSLKSTGSISPLAGGFDLMLGGKGTDLLIGDKIADGILAGVVDLSGRVARDTNGLTFDQFKLGNSQVQLAANGTYSNALADFKFTLDLADLKLLSEQGSGAVNVVGTAKGQDNVLALNLAVAVPSGTLAGKSLKNAMLGFAGQVDKTQLAGKITGAAALDGFTTQLGADLAITPTTQALTNIDFQAAGTRLTGSLTRSAAGLTDGALKLASPDISVAAALLLQRAKGALNADINLDSADGKQNAGIRADASGVVFNDIQVGSADVSATLSDLLGVPVINGSATAQKVSAAGIDIAGLTAKATQTGTTTAFDAQANLANGAVAVVAGSLAPLDAGYRLALDRASLTQGQLNATLAQPTVLTVNGAAVSLDAVRFNVGSGSITASGVAGNANNIVLDVNALPLSIANVVAPDLALGGTLNGKATITGSASNPAINFTADASGVQAAAIADLGVTPITASVNGTFNDNVVTLAAFRANGAGGLQLSGSGTVPLTGNGLNVTVTGAAPLALANRFVADRGGQASGTLALNAKVTGGIGAPQFGGTISTKGAGYIDPEANLRLQNITGSAALSGAALTIQSLSASLATGGNVSVSGSIGLSNGFPANLAIGLNSARYADGNLFVATASGNLTLTGSLVGNPLLAGNIGIEKADITVPENFGGGAGLIDVKHIDPPKAVAQTLARAKIDERAAPSPQRRSAGLLLDVNVNAPNQIFIRGRGLDAEVGGSVRLTGSLTDIQPVGGFALTRGRLAILGQRVTFESGTVTLVGDLDPFLNLVARTEGEGITVFVTVSGRASNIAVDFTSSPALPQDEVLSRLIFNRSVGELSPLQLAKLAGAVAELAGGGNNSLLDSLRGAAGLADLDLVTDDKGNVAVQAGAYIQDNVYLGVQAGANGQSKVTVNLDITSDLKAKASAGADGNSSVGVFYEKDY
ncbi:translocation/assembly module TamB domain-containing protein [Devosia sp.]|uniref:translocation/assembly module TamB domain-containing protein n=1 Tax=Devosia sp. TaxID=1871048 RepID=UPI00326575C9